MKRRSCYGVAWPCLWSIRSGVSTAVELQRCTLSSSRFVDTLLAASRSSKAHVRVPEDFVRSKESRDLSRGEGPPQLSHGALGLPVPYSPTGCQPDAGHVHHVHISHGRTLVNDLDKSGSSLRKSADPRPGVVRSSPVSVPFRRSRPGSKFSVASTVSTPHTAPTPGVLARPDLHPGRPPPLGLILGPSRRSIGTLGASPRIHWIRPGVNMGGTWGGHPVQLGSMWDV